MSKERFLAIRFNRIKLDCCKQHKFNPVTLPLNPQGKVVCMNCEGYMDLGSANQYMRGFEAAGGDSNEVWADILEEGKEIKTRCPKCLGETKDCDLCNGLNFVNVSEARKFLETFKKSFDIS